MKKGIILGIGILIILLALAGNGSAKADGSFGSVCSACHSPAVYPFTAVGLHFSETHRTNATSIAPPACANCHVAALTGNFALLTGTPTYVGSETCENCHKAKYDKWSNTLHRVMFTPRVDAEAMNLPLPADTTWDDIGFVRITKFGLAYVNTTGYFLTGNYTYDTEAQEFTTDSRAGAAYGTCVSCHTTGYDADGVSELPGIIGTYAEAGIGCERCHGAAGNGHQVTVDYSSDLCIDCHAGSHHGTGWEDGGHAPPASRNGASCAGCHSPFDKYTNDGAAERADSINVACGVCHDIHDMTDDQYADTFTDGTFNATEWSEVANAKLSFFNGTASLAAGTDVFDDLAAESALTGVNDATILCSKCHVPRHGLGHTNMPFTNLSHGSESAPATCIDCHMEGAGATVGKDMMDNHANEITTGASCGGGKDGCHGNAATGSKMDKRYEEWGASAHNVKEVGVGGDDYNHFYGVINEAGGSDKSRNPSCNKCHDPLNYNSDMDAATENEPLNENFKGVTCTVCHPIHDMGNWFAATEAEFGTKKKYGLFTKVDDGHWRGTYTMVESTTELCGSCHASVRVGDVLGWVEGKSSPNKAHGFPAADIFVGSWKQTGMLNFECTTCHMAILKKDETGTNLPYDETIRGHSFKVNTTLLQSNGRQGSKTAGYTYCNSCHIDGSALGNISTTIENVQARILVKYDVADAAVAAALAEVQAYEGEKSLSKDKMAQAYWNFRLIRSDESMGVHNPAMTEELLDDAVTLSAEAVASLGQVSDSSVSLKTGWNLVSLKGTPSVTTASSVMASVESNITVVWSYNAGTWELYDPTMPVALNSLKTIVPGKGYWVFATTDCEWTV